MRPIAFPDGPAEAGGTEALVPLERLRGQDVLEVAIVGMGPFGLCVLETLLRHLRGECSHPSAAPRLVRIHVVEPNQPGVGVHRLDLPDYLLLNTPCGQLDLFGSRHFQPDDRSPIPSFLEWLSRRNYGMDEEGQVTRSGIGRAVDPDDFLPRRLFGRYLAWVYRHLASADIPHVSVLSYRDEAVAIRSRLGREKIFLAQGETILVDHVFLTTGHTGNRREKSAAGLKDPYPVGALSKRIPPGARVAVAGLGLVAVDVLTALTAGRGGLFRAGSRPGSLSYRPSGDEPRICLYSRNGLPFFCRPRLSSDATGIYRPAIFTIQAVDRLRAGKGKLDFRADMLPLLYQEMAIVFYGRHAALVGDEEVASSLAAAARTGKLDEVMAVCRRLFGPFDPHALLFGEPAGRFKSAAAYEACFRELLERDVREAEKGEELSPLKASIEMLRVLRDTIRRAVDFGGLSDHSREDFSDVVASMINRVVVGPPLRRGRELLALIEAGIVELPFGPAPEVRFDPRGGTWLISSVALDRPATREVDAIIAGYLPVSTVDRSGSALLSQLFEDGRVRPYKPSARGAGIDVDESGHPRDEHGRPERNLTVFGPLTEGSRYFAHYIPSPKSRFRAFVDADAAAAALLARCRASGGEGAANAERPGDAGL